MRDEDTPPSHLPPTPTTTHELPSPPKGSRDVHPGISTIVNRSDFEFVSARKNCQGLAHGVTWVNNASSRLHRSVGFQCKKICHSCLRTLSGSKRRTRSPTRTRGDSHSAVPGRCIAEVGAWEASFEMVQCRYNFLEQPMVAGVDARAGRGRCVAVAEFRKNVYVEQPLWLQAD